METVVSELYHYNQVICLFSSVCKHILSWLKIGTSNYRWCGSSSEGNGCYITSTRHSFPLQIQQYFGFCCFWYHSLCKYFLIYSILVWLPTNCQHTAVWLLTNASTNLHNLYGTIWSLPFLNKGVQLSLNKFTLISGIYSEYYFPSNA